MSINRIVPHVLFFQADMKKILETVEGSDTIAYIRQLENERVSLRTTIRDTSTQLQSSKVIFHNSIF